MECLTEKSIAGPLKRWGYQVEDGSLVKEYDREVWIYFIRGDDLGPIKIGHTHVSPWKRASDLQCGYPHGILRVVGLIRGHRRIERELHTEFYKLRLIREWFRPDDSLLSRIDELKKDGI